jgi:glycosyltransferase involved in cell wall biosynthesis
MRIFIGLREIANIVNKYAQGFQDLGHSPQTVVLRSNPYYPQSNYNVVLEEKLGLEYNENGLIYKVIHRIKRQAFLAMEFLRALVRCDIFIFTYASSFLPRYWDYPILKLFGKRIVSVFCGSDIRYWRAYEQEFAGLHANQDARSLYYDVNDHTDDFYSIKIFRVRAAERYSDLILSLPSFGQLQTRPYMRMNLPVILSQLRCEIPEREHPVVLHAPSRRHFKGTRYVLMAIEKLRAEGIPFEFHLVENTDNERLKEMLTTADIVIDQLFSLSIATLSLEAMAAGNVVLTRFAPEYSRISPECPAVNVNADTLADKLREVILNIDLRKELASAGRAYVEKYHDHRYIAQQILDWIEPGGVTEYDFIPDFFSTKFDLSPEIIREEDRTLRAKRIRKLTHKMSLPSRKE